jgi:hypothetical protein
MATTPPIETDDGNEGNDARGTNAIDEVPSEILSEEQHRATKVRGYYQQMVRLLQASSGPTINATRNF